jgi:hypothetical protein
MVFIVEFDNYTIGLKRAWRNTNKISLVNNSEVDKISEFQK